MALWLRIVLATAAPDEIAEAARLHREQVAELRRAGRLRIAGEIGDEDGFVEVFEAADRLAAEQIAEASPLVARGLATWMVRPWTERD
jgi:uncharacterized protein YciI